MFELGDHGTVAFDSKNGEIEKGFEVACEWLLKLGINYVPTRYGHYQRRIDGYLNKSIARSSCDGRRELIRFLNSQLEAIQLIRIHTAFCEVSTPVLTGKIKEIASGHELSKSENNSKARDLAFELGVAARFIKGGYHVDIESITDVTAIIDGCKVYVECKRIKSITKLRSRIKKANDQLAKRIKKDTAPRSRGLIAIEITQLMTDVDTIIFDDDLESYKRKSTEIAHQFVASYKKDLECARIPKALGVLTEFSTQGVLVNDSATFVNSRESTMYIFKRGSRNANFCQKFLPNLAGQSLF